MEEHSALPLMVTTVTDNEKVIGTVYILGKPFEVYMADNVSMSDDPKMGMIQYSHHRIFVDRDMDSISKKNVLLHEMIHAVDSIMGCGMDEDDILRMEAGMSTILFDERNKDIWEALDE